jgi:hypothetical protein
MAGDDVADWQNFLVTQGRDPGPIDGEFGGKTDTATKAFQAANGLVPDGIVGNDTFTRAMALGFKPLPHHNDPAPSAKKVKVKDIADGVTIWKLPAGEAVFFTSDLDVDADGSPMAYGPGNSGLDNNGNAQDPVSSGKWNPNVLLLDANKQPVQQAADDLAPGFFLCFSTLQDTSQPRNRARRYVDALTIPFMVLPGGSAGPARMGDVGLVIDTQSGKRVKCLVADAGPGGKTGEASIRIAGILLDDLTPKQIVAAALKDRLKGLKCNPRNGGSSAKRFRYIVFPGTASLWTHDNNPEVNVAKIEARVDGALAALTPEQLATVLTG